jgi:hypothetical protein
MLAEPDRDLAWQHRLGCILNEANQDAVYGSGLIRWAAKQLGQSHAAFYRSMQLAKYYPGDQLATLTGLPWTTVQALLTVSDGQIREKLQQRAIKGHWSVKYLRRVINRELGRVREYFRKRKRRTDLEDLERLVQLGQIWLRFVEDVWPGDRLRRQPGERSLARLVRQTQVALGGATEAAQQALKAAHNRNHQRGR